MLETIREYAFDRLRESGETARLQSRFLDFFLNFGQRAHQELSGPAQGEWLERLDAEEDNFRAALTWTAQEQDLQASQLRLALTLRRFWLVRGYWEEGLNFFLRVISTDSVREFVLERSVALNSCGNLACQLGRYAEATQHYEQSLAFRRELADERGIAATLNNLGNVYLHQRDCDKAEPLFSEALAYFRKFQDERGVAACLNNLASVQNTKHEFSSADGSAREALEIFRSVGDDLGVAASLTELGKIAISQNDVGSARAYLEESLGLCRQLGEKVGIVGSLQSLGELMMIQNHYESARSLYKESLDIATDLAAVRYMITAKDALNNLSHAESGVALEVHV
jgi:tetratricopeptide (TPR) repeat protein